LDASFFEVRFHETKDETLASMKSDSNTLLARDSERKTIVIKRLISVVLFVLLSAIVIPNYFHARTTAFAKQREAEIEYRHQLDTRVAH